MEAPRGEPRLRMGGYFGGAVYCNPGPLLSVISVSMRQIGAFVIIPPLPFLAIIPRTICIIPGGHDDASRTALESSIRATSLFNTSCLH